MQEPGAILERAACFVAGLSFLRSVFLRNLALAAPLALAMPLVAGQAPYRKEFDDYTVVYSAVRADTIPEEVARRHALPSTSNAALLNVTVQRDGANVEAVIDARATNLARQTRDIEMRETVANELVSYLGVVEIADREVLDFVIDVMPEGARQSYRIEFRETFRPKPRADPLRR